MQAYLYQCNTGSDITNTLVIIKIHTCIYIAYISTLRLPYSNDGRRMDKITCLLKYKLKHGIFKILKRLLTLHLYLLSQDP